MESEYQTDPVTGQPNGIELSNNGAMQDRLSKVITITGEENWVLCRWLCKQNVWVLDHVYTLGREAVESIKGVQYA